ncbi:hypothetical protein [Phenylobacterium sp.]|uniref:hypothetical protein n=1 Tax=Phenylobacterium sp. TaxID=1871053 RepID=UPI0025D16FA9|nr:hypothetical protein [Phenylobacterium sp.]
MPDAAVARTDHELQLLGALVDGAYALGMAFNEAAEAEADHTRKLELFDAFLRGSLAVRMGIRLSMTLRAPPKAAQASAVERDESEKAEVERDETERLDVERERDRDYEPVSLPKFLATLGVVAADAGRLDGVAANIRQTVLPALNDLLARAKAGATVASGPVGATRLARPPPAAPRTALLASAAAAPARPLIPHPPPRRSG